MTDASWAQAAADQGNGNQNDQTPCFFRCGHAGNSSLLHHAGFPHLKFCFLSKVSGYLPWIVSPALCAVVGPAAGMQPFLGTSHATNILLEMLPLEQTAPSVQDPSWIAQAVDSLRRCHSLQVDSSPHSRVNSGGVRYSLLTRLFFSVLNFLCGQRNFLFPPYVP